MSRWTVEVIPAAERELKALPDDLQGKFLHVAACLRSSGQLGWVCRTCGELEGKLWEMRLAGPGNIARAIYSAASGRRPVVVRVFVKKSPKTPRREIALAGERMKEQNGG